MYLNKLKYSNPCGRGFNMKSALKQIIFFILIESLVAFFPIFLKAPCSMAEMMGEDFVLPENSLIVFQNNTLSPASPLTQNTFVYASQGKPERMNVVVTAYSSTPWETDETPFITASGKPVREGIVANNFLPFGTKIRIPEIFGEKIFVVEDRMHWRKGYHHIDVWFPNYQEALAFGAKKTYIEILGK